MARRRGLLAIVLLAVLTGPACGPKTRAEEAGIDQEITRNILWRFHKDIRFADIHVLCEDRTITLDGRVSDAKSMTDALQIALSEARGGTVVNKIVVRPK